MSTLLEIKTAVANNLELAVADLTVNGQDMFLFASNQVRRQAVMSHDFEFNRRLVTLTVNGVTGGSLSAAVLYGTATPVVVNTIVAVGTFDDNANLRPVEWTTVAEGLIRQYEEQPGFVPRYPTDGQALAVGQKRFVFSGDNVYFFPRAEAGSSDSYELGLEVYADQEDWTAANLGTAEYAASGTLSPDVSGDYEQITPDAGHSGVFFHDGTVDAFLDYNGTDWVIYRQTTGTAGARWTFTTGSTTPDGTYSPAGGATGTLTLIPAAAPGSLSNVWTTYGEQYLTWATVVFLNKRFKFFVARTEGNLAPPEDLAAAGLQTLKDWDIARFEQSRRHGR